MAYYVSPPGGKISITEAERYCLKRIILLQNVVSSGGDQDKLKHAIENLEGGAEFFQEGSRSDKISHFFLR